jgi:hypothetical protein
MPRGVVYDTFTEAQEYADRVNGEPMEVEGGFSVVSPLGYSDGGPAIKPVQVPKGVVDQSRYLDRLQKAIIHPMIKGNKKK